MGKAHAVDRYARDVLSGRIVAGPLVRLACERHQRDRKAKRWTFDAARADHAIDFFANFLRLPDTLDEYGDHRPFVLMPFLQFITGSLFGWVSADGLRRYREAYIEIGKGNAKTPWLAGVGLYGLTMDGERAAEIYAAATDRDQAGIMFRDAKRMVEASPALAKRVQVSVGNLAYTKTQSFFRPFSREQGQKSGSRPHMGLIDEVHEHPSGEIINKIRAGTKGRKQPLNIEITNSGFDRTSICWEHHEHARRVLERTTEDDQFFAYVCALDEGDDPLTDESCWPKANPALGVTIGEDYLRRQVQNAKNIPAETNTVLRLNFCVWTQASERFVTAAQWQACAGAVDPKRLAGAPCYGGLDLGQSDDFSALLLVWLLEDGRVAVRPQFWVPEAAIAKRPERPWQLWREKHALTVTEGQVTDYDVVERDVIAACKAAGVRELAYDKRFAEHMALHLRVEDIDAIDMPQGFYLTGGLKKLSELVAGQQLLHDGNLVLAWMADNLVVRNGPDKTMRPDKEKSKDKIDGMVALVMALARAIVAPPVEQSVYETSSILIL